MGRSDTWIESSSSPYNSFSELIELALRNQLEIDLLGASPPPPAGAAAGGTALLATVEKLDKLLRLPDRPYGETADDAGRISAAPLTFLTNRLNPVPVVVRVLANLGPVSLKEGQQEVGRVARQVGLKLRSEDKAANRSQSERRATSWPVGEDEFKSVQKFVFSYLVDDMGRGPLADLGLAAVVGGQLVLTPLGVTLAATLSPQLGETDDGTVLGAEARRILEGSILRNKAEVQALRVFFDAIAESKGQQSAIDRYLTKRNGWNEGVAVSSRAAYIGRLRDLEMLEVSGHGPKAELVLTEAGQRMANQITAQAAP